ncbi:MAG TPA: hypothetical protein VK680_10295 [Solirubrobacteraceae bacterium]|jgi:hypothetical protein|nr:hypothetical protein [Solirubrobacteraceae bacterium]
MSVLASRLIDLHDALAAADLPHAFGGAIALAFCTERPRGTRDLDVNVFVAPQRAKDVFAALPDGVTRSTADLETARNEGQVQLWWQDTPIDIFLNVHPFHDEVARGVRQVPFAGRVIPVVSCTALAVFKSLIGRTKDWADIEAMVEMGEMSASDAIGWLTQIVGVDSPAATRMRALAA